MFRVGTFRVYFGVTEDKEIARLSFRGDPVRTVRRGIEKKGDGILVGDRTELLG